MELIGPSGWLLEVCHGDREIEVALDALAP